MELLNVSKSGADVRLSTDDIDSIANALELYNGIVGMVVDNEGAEYGSKLSTHYYDSSALLAMMRKVLEIIEEEDEVK